MRSRRSELIAEHASFPNGAHDDQVDSTSQALIRLRGEINRTPRGHDDDDPEKQRAVSAGLSSRVF